MSAQRYKHIDLSVGDAAFPFKGLAKRAFEDVQGSLHQYINNPLQLGGGDSVLVDAQHAMREYINKLGWRRPGYSGYGYDSFAFVDGGTTHAYSLVIQIMKKHADEFAKKTGEVIKPVLIAPVPSYGYFLSIAKEMGIEVATVQRDLKTGALDIEELRNVIFGLHEEGKTIFGYYDCSPSNPLGTIRSLEETQAVARIFMDLQHYYSEHHKGTHWPYEYPLMIDDQVYRGLQYDKNAVIPALANVQADGFHDKNGYRQTITLLGPSKAGLADWRIGVAAGSVDIIKLMRERNFSRTYFPSKLTLATVKHFFDPNLQESQEMVTDHFATLNAEHEMRGLLMKALINGMGTMDELDETRKTRLISFLEKHSQYDEKQARKMLIEGIRGVNVLTTPEAGFFHVIDFSEARQFSSWGQIQDAEFYPEEDKAAWLADPSHLKRDFVKSFKDDQNIHMAALAWTGYPDKDANLHRVSFALPVSEIIEFARRLRATSASYFKLSESESWKALHAQLTTPTI